MLQDKSEHVPFLAQQHQCGYHSDTPEIRCLHDIQLNSTQSNKQHMVLELHNKTYVNTYFHIRIAKWIFSERS